MNLICPNTHKVCFTCKQHPCAAAQIHPNALHIPESAQNNEFKGILSTFENLVASAEVQTNFEDKVSVNVKIPL